MKGRPSFSQLHELYSTSLYDDIVPFWLRHSIDREFGGYLTCLDRTGKVYSTDKAMWLQGREVWMFSRLFNAVEKKQEWLDAAARGFDFLSRHGFDTDGRMFFSVTRDGKPLRKRRYLFTETFGAIACSEFAIASGDERAAVLAKDTYRLLVELYRTPGALEAKIFPQTRRNLSLSMPMILLATTHEMQKLDSDPLYEEVLDESVFAILNRFLNPELKLLHETIGESGDSSDSPEGRNVNPGHSIETACFLLHEADRKEDSVIRSAALDILKGSLESGWDEVHGGLFAFIDVEDRPCEQLEWDMKLWWPHTEALYATLLAWDRSGDDVFLDWFFQLHRYTFSHFPDPGFGEWYGYLHRDGSVANQLKGSMWKGMFHIPRALLQVSGLLDRMMQREQQAQ